jgi:hypothetical protein
VRLHTLNRTVPVQVKFFAVPNDQDAVVLRNRRADEVVLVSPIELARFLEAHFDPEQFGCDWAHFLELFPSKPRNLVQLSWELYQLFRRFLDRPITHPFDPVHSVPALLKKAIFALLEARAPTLVIPEKPPTRRSRNQAVGLSPSSILATWAPGNFQHRTLPLQLGVLLEGLSRSARLKWDESAYGVVVPIQPHSVWGGGGGLPVKICSLTPLSRRSSHAVQARCGRLFGSTAAFCLRFLKNPGI